jgi:hypothetical protein
MKEKNYSRRKFLSECVYTGSMFFGAVIAINGCEPKEPASTDKKESASKDRCDDFSSVSKSEMEKREKFGYVDKSLVDGNFCGNCSLYVPYKEEKNCGDCMLFKGPVHFAGHCIQYVPKQ